jgi:hypothetical protein
MVKQYRKRLNAIVKQWAPYDYADMMQLMFVSLQGMREYYEKGINVLGCETKDWLDPNMPTRAQICDILVKSLEDYYTSTDASANFDEFFVLLSKFIYELWD